MQSSAKGPHRETTFCRNIPPQSFIPFPMNKTKLTLPSPTLSHDSWELLKLWDSNGSLHPSQAINLASESIFISDYEEHIWKAVHQTPMLDKSNQNLLLRQFFTKIQVLACIPWCKASFFIYNIYPFTYQKDTSACMKILPISLYSFCRSAPESSRKERCYYEIWGPCLGGSTLTQIPCIKDPSKTYF